MDWIKLIKAMLIGILANGNIWIIINIFDSDVYAYIFLAECLIAIFIFKCLLFVCKDNASSENYKIKECEMRFYFNFRRRPYLVQTQDIS